MEMTKGQKDRKDRKDRENEKKKQKQKIMRKGIIKQVLPFASRFAVFQCLPHFILHSTFFMQSMFAMFKAQKSIPSPKTDITPPSTTKRKFQLFIAFFTNMRVICASHTYIISRFQVLEQVLDHIPIFDRLPLRCRFSNFI